MPTAYFLSSSLRMSPKLRAPTATQSLPLAQLGTGPALQERWGPAAERPGRVHRKGHAGSNKNGSDGDCGGDGGGDDGDGDDDEGDGGDGGGGDGNGDGGWWR